MVMDPLLGALALVLGLRLGREEAPAPVQLLMLQQEALPRLAATPGQHR